MNRKGIDCILLISLWLPSIFLTGCRNSNYTDPFWGINLDAGKSAILKNLKDKSLKGDLRNCVFSFERIFYVKTDKFDARITGSLNNPAFADQTLEKLSYLFLVDFKNEVVQSFDLNFYNYFECELGKVYGKPQKKSITGDEVSIDWALGNGGKVMAHVFKSTNTYQVTFQKR